MAYAPSPGWIRPGDTATLIWHNGAVQGRDGVLRYQVAGPIFDVAPASPYFLLAPATRDGFADELYRGQVSLDDLRRFLDECVVAQGEMVDAMGFVAASAETPALRVVDAWRDVASRPRFPYEPAIGAFIPESRLLYVTAEAHAVAQRVPETFFTAWVCEECGEAEDAAVFLWTAHREDSIRVCFLIENDAGVWTCSLHPFDIEKLPQDAEKGPSASLAPLAARST